MSEVLLDYVSDLHLVPSLSKQKLNYSRAEVENSTSIPCLYVQTLHSFRKDDNYLFVNGAKIADLTQLTIKDLCQTLEPFCQSISYIEYDEFLNLPALLLTNMENKETRATILTTNPYDLERINVIKNKGIISIENSLKPLVCMKTSTNQRLISEVISNKISVKGSFADDIELYHSVHSSEFIWKINIGSLVTTSKEFISKYIGSVE